MDKLESSDGELLDRATSTIVSQVEALRQLVDAFSDYAAEPVLHMSDLRIEQLIQDVVALYREGDPRLELRLDLCPGPPGLIADGGQIRQLLHNLIRNSCEAVESDQAPEISIRSSVLDKHGESWLELEVSDHGPGFPDIVLENPFEPYVSHKANGSGLGLAICRKIVMDHDGAITITNLEGGGAIARILLPLNRKMTQAKEHRIIG